MEHISKIIKKTENKQTIIQTNIPKENTDILFKDNGCTICGGFGQVHPLVEGKIDYSKLINCECQKNERYKHHMELLMKNCSLPPFAKSMTLENFKVFPELNKVFKDVKKIADKPGDLFWLALIGENGGGKTHLAISIVQKWLNAGIASHYELVSIMLDELRAGYRFEMSGDYELSYSRKFDYYCNVPLLLLDDYGVEKKNDWAQEKLDTIVDYRLMHNLSLLVTSNLPLDDFSPRIRSRVTRHPNGQVINVNTVDYGLRDKK